MEKERTESWWARRREQPWEICNRCGLLRCPYCLPMNCPTWRAFAEEAGPANEVENQKEE